MNKKEFIKNAQLVKELLTELKGDIRKLVEYGFERVTAGPGSIESFYKHDLYQMVVKRPYLMNDTLYRWENERENFFPEHVVKTVVVDIESETRCGYEGRLIFIQPIVETDNQTGAYRALDQMGTESPDFASRNCGWLDGKPVIFDF